MRVAVISGWVAAYPEGGGGYAWSALQYVLGLRSLGHEVVWIDFLEMAGDEEAEPGRLCARFGELAARFGVADFAFVLDDDGRQLFGPQGADLASALRGCDAVISMCGAWPPYEPLACIQRRGYIDGDPGFTQMWAFETDMGFDAFTHFFTWGTNVGTPDFPVPTDIPWIHTLPPVALDAWPVAVGDDGRYTTIGQWRGEHAFYEGEYYGQKAASWERIMDVPLRVNVPMEAALLIHESEEEDIAALTSNNWILTDPTAWALTPEAFQHSIQRSRGEFSVAKEGYVLSRSGWVGDRTVAYLASGKPAIVEDTGFTRHLPAGKGLLGFTGPDEAVAAIESVEANYNEHAKAARALAEEYFDARKVLTEMLDAMG